MKKLFFFFLNWAELGLVKGCLCLVGGYWASFGFSLGQGGALCKMLIFFFFWQGVVLYCFLFGHLDLFIIRVGLTRMAWFFFFFWVNWTGYTIGEFNWAGSF